MGGEFRTSAFDVDVNGPVEKNEFKLNGKMSVHVDEQ